MGIGTWQPLKLGPFGIGADQPGIDPMWVWAEATGYREHFPRGVPAEGAWFAVETTEGEYGAQRLTPDAWQTEGLRRIELAEPVVPERPIRRDPATTMPGFGETPRSNARVLVGIIDSGCPFAARMIRNKAGTRVLSIWDQDEAPAFAARGYRPAELSYGCAVDRKRLNEIIGSASRSGTVDEDLCYRLAGYDAVKERSSHGAAVISQLFAKPIHGGALQPKPGQPPSWDKTPLIESADLVFVQLPRAAVQDSTSAALARYVIDGLYYIALHRGQKTKRIIVNISNGTSRTTHDGKSLPEQAILDWIEKQQKAGVDARVIVPVGNTNREQRHAELWTHSDEPGTPDARPPLQLFLPPDCEMPQYLTVRIPAGASGVKLKVTPPGGQACEVGQGQAMGWPSADRPECGVISPPPAIIPTPVSSLTPEVGLAARALLAFAPTKSTDPKRAIARSGRWKIEIVCDGKRLAEPVRFWISRNQRNPGAVPRSRQADFVDFNERHSPNRYMRETLDDDPKDSDPETAKNGIRRRGALNGLATVSDTQAQKNRFVVVGGYIVMAQGFRPSKYSAAGPAQSAFTSAPGDTSSAVPGLTVRGNRSGEVARVVGTSFAAPLLARALANEVAVPQKPPRAPGAKVPKDESRRGGRLQIAAPEDRAGGASEAPQASAGEVVATANGASGIPSADGVDRRGPT